MVSFARTQRGEGGSRRARGEELQESLHAVTGSAEGDCGWVGVAVVVHGSQGGARAGRFCVGLASVAQRQRRDSCQGMERVDVSATDLLIIRTKVERDGEHTVRRDAADRAVECELPNRDAHAVHAKVAEPKNARAVGHDDNLAALTRPVIHHRAHRSAVLRADVHTTRALVTTREGLAHLANCWRVNERSDFFHVIDKYTVEERLVAVLKILELQILLKWVFHSPQAVNDARRLLLYGLDARRQKAAQTKAVALSLCERGPLRYVRHTFRR
eukprot:5990927-Pleurochrysis_carterae.AAC.2